MMQLMRHLNDEELSELLMESDQRDLQPVLDALPASLRETAERPEWFWQRQQAVIHSRVAAAEGGWLKPVTAWASVFALVLLALLLLRSNPAPQPAQARTDPDQELLIAVERAMQTDVPEALEPASLLADEISSPQVNSNHISKENQHEN
jgi:hypothetical protein